MLAALLPQNRPVFFYKLAKIRLFVNLYQNLPKVQHCCNRYFHLCDQIIKLSNIIY